MKTAIISPHTDDAIFSLGDLIPKLGKCTIITPFAGIPEDIDGYKKHIVLRYEHERACNIIGADIINGEFLDDVYPDRKLDGLQHWMIDQIKGFDRVIVPLGIHHPDHILIRRLFSNSTLLKPDAFYEELPYRILYPDTAIGLRQHLHKNAQQFEPGVKTTDLKRQAVETYKSQIIGHHILAQLYVEERLWL